MTRKPKAVLPADLDLDTARTKPGKAGKPAFIHEQAAPTGGVKERTAATSLYLMPADHRCWRLTGTSACKPCCWTRLTYS